MEWNGMEKNRIKWNRIELNRIERKRMHLFYLMQKEILSDSKYTPSAFIFSLILLSQRKTKRKGVRKIKRKKEKIFYRV